MANHMSEVAKILGVELEEEFKIIFNGVCSNFNYYFTDKGLFKCEDNIIIHCGLLIEDLLTGKATIKRVPWKPRMYDVYWVVNPEGNVFCDKYYEYFMDVNFYKLGNCYRTKEEAEANRDKWIKFYASNDVLEV